MTKAITLIPTEIAFGIGQYRYHWLPFYDKVTGGNSTSKLKLHRKRISYSGIIRNINNSAWSYMRSNKEVQDLSMHSLVEIKLKTDECPYVFEMEYNEGWQNEKLGFMIHTLPYHWTTVQLPIAEFKHIKFKKNTR
jgi:hypothetical protein